MRFVLLSGSENKEKPIKPTCAGTEELPANCKQARNPYFTGIFRDYLRKIV